MVNGEVEIQFYNQSRGQGWVTIGTNSPIEDLMVILSLIAPLLILYAVLDTSSTG